MTKSADRRRQKRAAVKKKDQKALKHKERFRPPDAPCTINANFGQAFLYRNGPLLVASWGVPSVIRTAIIASGRTPPVDVSGALLLDTGATNTCISLKAAHQLGLQATRVQEGYGAGGLHKNPVFFAHLGMTIVNEKTGIGTEMHWEQEVQGVPDLELHARGIKAQGQEVEVVGLLGRDILRHTRLSYDGIDGKLKITFDLKSLQQQPGR